MRTLNMVVGNTKQSTKSLFINLFGLVTIICYDFELKICRSSLFLGIINFSQFFILPSAIQKQFMEILNLFKFC